MKEQRPRILKLRSVCWVVNNAVKHITAEAVTKEQYSCYNVRSGSPDNCVDGWELKMTNTATPAATREEAEVTPPQTPLSTLWKPESEGRGRLQERGRTDCCCCCTDYSGTKHPESLLAIHLEVEYVRFLLFSDIKITHANTYYLSGCCRDALAYKSCSPDEKK